MIDVADNLNSGLFIFIDEEYFDRHHWISSFRKIASEI